MKENNFLKRVTQAHPAKIYILMAAAHHNLELIKGSSPATNGKMHWNQSGNLHEGNPIKFINRTHYYLFGHSRNTRGHS
jgi:hypothetical protein